MENSRMKYFGDEYLKWTDTKSKLTDITLKELIYNKYTEMSPNESIYHLSTPNNVLIELIKRLKQMKLMMQYPGKYDKLIAESLGLDPEQIDTVLTEKKEDYIR